MFSRGGKFSTSGNRQDSIDNRGGELVKMLVHKVERHKKLTSKTNKKNRVLVSPQCVPIGDDGQGGFLLPLKQCVETSTFFMRCSQCMERCFIL